MPSVHRLGDICTGHDACPPVPLVSASSNVLVNGKGAARVGDSYASHGCLIHPPHTPVCASGSSTVFVNGKALVRVGDAVSCGGSTSQGSGNVNAG